MYNNYWKEYWENYHEFMAMYLRELQKYNPGQDIAEEYLDVASFFTPPMPFEDEDDLEVFEENDSYYYAQQQAPTPFISPGGGKFTINNCRRMAVVRIEMRRGFNPSSFFMLVDRADSRSIQGFRIACESGRVRFIPMAVEYRNINLIECAF